MVKEGLLIEGLVTIFTFIGLGILGSMKQEWLFTLLGLSWVVAAIWRYSRGPDWKGGHWGWE